MKILKKILFGLAGLVIAFCLGILICALNPSLTNFLAGKVNAVESEKETDGSETGGETRAPGQLPQGVPGVNADWISDRENRGYLVPDSAPEDVPEAVSGRTGYEPVNGDVQQVLDGETDGVDPGELGENLDFDPLYYPYYAMLDQDMQTLYRQIYANAAQAAPSFSPAVDVDLERLKRVFEAVYNDHPELFWLETGFSCKCLEDGSCVEILLRYNETANDLSGAKEIFFSQAQSILTEAARLGNDYEKEKYVHDALAQRIRYDASAGLNQSAYGGLVIARTVCAGYARAFQYLLQQLEIPCYYCTGNAGENHAWDIVRIGGEYYNVDVTWDDTEEIGYDYFNKTDAEFAPTHVRTGLSVYLPACMGTEFAGNKEPATGEETGEPEETPAASEEPAKPLTWESRGKSDEEKRREEEEAAKEERLRSLEKAGITEEDVLSTMEAYYADCAEQLKKAGTGEHTFSNVVPGSLWNTVEQAYTGGGYRSGYVDGVLKELGAESFYIQLQVQDLGGGYYRIYHNVLVE